MVAPLLHYVRRPTENVSLKVHHGQWRPGLPQSRGLPSAKQETDVQPPEPLRYMLALECVAMYGGVKDSVQLGYLLFTERLTLLLLILGNPKVCERIAGHHFAIDGLAHYHRQKLQ